jgi:hypothetical protein
VRTLWHDFKLRLSYLCCCTPLQTGSLRPWTSKWRSAALNGPGVVRHDMLVCTSTACTSTIGWVQYALTRYRIAKRSNDILGSLAGLPCRQVGGRISTAVCALTAAVLQCGAELTITALLWAVLCWLCTQHNSGPLLSEGDDVPYVQACSEWQLCICLCMLYSICHVAWGFNQHQLGSYQCRRARVRPALVVM